MTTAIRILEPHSTGVALKCVISVLLDPGLGWQWFAIDTSPKLIEISTRPSLWCTVRGNDSVFFYPFCYDASATPHECFSYNVHTGVRSPLPGIRVGGVWPLWSPDARQLVFGEMALPGLTKAGIWLTECDQYGKTLLRLDLGPLHALHWQDHRSLCVVHETDFSGHYRVSRVRIADGSVETICEFSLPGWANHIALSANAEWLAYYGVAMAEDVENMELCVLSLHEQKIVHRVCTMYESIPSWSPTGDFLAFAGYGRHEAPCMTVIRPPSFEQPIEYIIDRRPDPDPDIVATKPMWFGGDLLLIASLESVYPRTLSKIAMLEVPTGDVHYLAEVDGLVGQIVCPFCPDRNPLFELRETKA